MRTKTIVSALILAIVLVGIISFVSDGFIYGSVVKELKTPVKKPKTGATVEEVVKESGEGKGFSIQAASISSCINLTTPNEVYTLSSNLSGFQANRTVCIDIQADNVTLDCQGHSLIGTGSGYGIYADGVYNATLKNCVVSNYGTNIYFKNSNKIKIFDIQTNKGNGISLSGSNDVDIDCNNKVLNGNGVGGTGISINSNNVKVSNCFISGFTKIPNRGISVSGSNITLRNNNIGDSYYKIALFSGSNISVIKNNLHGFDVCIYLGTKDTTIANNTLSCDNGINVRNTENVIENNTFSCQDYNIFVVSSFFELYCNNKIQNNTGKNNLPILYLNTTSNLNSGEYSEVVLCNADNSN
ncbi:MAG: right-handed parallel beta-helix repeat-containing protein, partial [Nanoarchaeota archaeon]|nr:right-handed parallel beta-helix repeat-containing protein [Nanoarchaeota archaeon]